jgi:DNA helicase-2/ATP-dependent DNA helicase PcrA
MEQLYITHAESRRLYGKETYPRPSRFIREIPAEHIQEIRIRANVTRTVTTPKPKRSSIVQEGTYKLGQQVRHGKFGDGIVLQMEGEGAQERVQINFRSEGLKWLMITYAKLETLS